MKLSEREAAQQAEERAAQHSAEQQRKAKRKRDENNKADKEANKKLLQASKSAAALKLELQQTKLALTRSKKSEERLQSEFNSTFPRINSSTLTFQGS